MEHRTKRTKDKDIIVPVKEELYVWKIFGFKAFEPTARMLGYIGYRHQVIPILQILCHGARTFIVSTDGLPRYIIRNHKKKDIIKVLRDADKKGQLEIAREWQEIDLDLVEYELSRNKGFSAKTAVLAKKYPSLNIFLLGKLNQYEKLKKYILECKA